MGRHVRQGDTVEVIAGNDRGRRGRILRVDPGRERVIVEGVNLRKKHVRAGGQYPQGGRVEKEMPVHISNVQPVSPSANRPTRVRFERREDGSKVRVAVKGEDVLHTLKKGRS